MYLTVTLNPALDKTLFVSRNAPQETLRAARAVDLAGGKGINVARALLALGAKARALAPLGGFPGAHLADLARREGIEVLPVEISGQTRTALTIQDAETGRYWHYLEPGPRLSAEELERLRTAFLAALEGCHTAVLSGSLPCAEAGPLLAWMAGEARVRGLRVALDSFGWAQNAALRGGAWLAKPTLDELQSALGEALDTEVARWAALERLAGWGIDLAVLSLGAEGALALAEGRRFRVIPPGVEEVNDLGGGDSMVAGICWAAASGYKVPDCLAWGAACGAANAAVWDPAAIRREEVERLLPEVRIVPGG